jgi:hypothetical protein
MKSLLEFHNVSPKIAVLYSHLCIMACYRCQFTSMKSPETIFQSRWRVLNRVSAPSYHPAAYCQGGRCPAPPACIVRTPSSRHRAYNIFRPRLGQSCPPFHICAAGKHYTICRSFSLLSILVYKITSRWLRSSVFGPRPFAQSPSHTPA